MFGSPLIFETDPSRPHLPDGSPPDPGLWLCTGTGFGFGLSPPPQTSPPHLPSQKKKKKKGAGGSPQARTGIENKRTLTICAPSSAAHGLDSALDSAAGGKISALSCTSTGGFVVDAGPGAGESLPARLFSTEPFSFLSDGSSRAIGCRSPPGAFRNRRTNQPPGRCSENAAGL